MEFEPATPSLFPLESFSVLINHQSYKQIYEQTPVYNFRTEYIYIETHKFINKHPLFSENERRVGLLCCFCFEGFEVISEWPLKTMKLAISATGSACFWVETPWISVEKTSFGAGLSRRWINPAME